MRHSWGARGMALLATPRRHVVSHWDRHSCGVLHDRRRPRGAVCHARVGLLHWDAADHRGRHMLRGTLASNWRRRWWLSDLSLEAGLCLRRHIVGHLRRSHSCVIDSVGDDIVLRMAVLWLVPIDPLGILVVLAVLIRRLGASLSLSLSFSLSHLGFSRSSLP